MYTTCFSGVLLKLGAFRHLLKTDSEAKNKLLDLTKNPMAPRYATMTMKKEMPTILDDFGSRSPVIQKKKTPKRATSIVSCITNTNTTKTSSRPSGAQCFLTRPALPDSKGPARYGSCRCSTSPQQCPLLQRIPGQYVVVFS